MPLKEEKWGQGTGGEIVLQNKEYNYSSATLNTSSYYYNIANMLQCVTENNQAPTRIMTTSYFYNSILTPQIDSTFDPIILLLPTGTTDISQASDIIPGILLKVEYPKQTVEKYWYQYLSANSIVVNTNESTRNYDPSRGMIYYKPWKTEFSFDDKILTSYKGYDLLENPIIEVNINRFYSSIKYDLFGRITKLFLPGSFNPQENLNVSEVPENNSSGSISYVYDDLNNRISSKSYMNFLTGQSVEIVDQYDALGKHISSEKNNTKVFNKTYNGFGQLVSEEVYPKGDAAKITKSYSYDYLGRILSIFIGDAESGYAIDNYSYNIENGSFTRNSKTVNYVRKNTVTDANGKTIVTYFDLIGKKVAEQIGANNPTLFEYNEAYQLIRVITPEGLETTYTYDNLGYLSSKTSIDEGSYNYKYNKFGELRYQFHTTQTPFELLFHNYDKLGRLISTGKRSITQNTFNDLNPDIESTDDSDQQKLLLVNIYDDIANRSDYSTVFSGFAMPVAQDQIHNTKGRLAVTAYRDTTSNGAKWKYKVYSYDPMGNVEKTYLKEL